MVSLGSSVQFVRILAILTLFLCAGCAHSAVSSVVRAKLQSLGQGVARDVQDHNAFLAVQVVLMGLSGSTAQVQMPALAIVVLREDLSGQALIAVQDRDFSGFSVQVDLTNLPELVTLVGSKGLPKLALLAPLKSFSVMASQAPKRLNYLPLGGLKALSIAKKLKALPDGDLPDIALVQMSEDLSDLSEIALVQMSEDLSDIALVQMFEDLSDLSDIALVQMSEDLALPDLSEMVLGEEELSSKPNVLDVAKHQGQVIWYLKIFAVLTAVFLLMVVGVEFLVLQPYRAGLKVRAANFASRASPYIF